MAPSSSLHSSDSTVVAEPEPVLQDSLRYWERQSATYNGVLGGYGSGSLPRVDSLGSRKFLLYILPELSTIRPYARPVEDLSTSQSLLRTQKFSPRRFRALDVGAGIGRVTVDTLLPLIHDVVLLEPVESLLRAAIVQGHASATQAPSKDESRLPLQKRKWKGIADGSKSVTFLQGTLQACDPAHPSQTATFRARVGHKPLSPDDESGFDVVWCQWCLSYMADADLIAFLKRSQATLREGGAIVVKENVCKDGDGGVLDIHFDAEDSSVMRSDLYWKKIFRDAGLNLFHERVQDGLPKGLFMVKM
ncbi:DUF858-domain-containing protein [Russula emetica]|nr:DUF858-domain-containing protein [Russula emetica]